VDSDTEKVTSIALKLVDSLVKEASYTIDQEEYDTIRAQIGELAQELVRAGGGELHNIGALTGGMVSQEVIKVITEQYVPVDNTCVFDGVRSKTSVFRV
jgi:amyloid beta precursor protein binding protein 1